MLYTVVFFMKHLIGVHEIFHEKFNTYIVYKTPVHGGHSHGDRSAGWFYFAPVLASTPSQAMPLLPC